MMKIKEGQYEYLPQGNITNTVNDLVKQHNIAIEGFLQEQVAKLIKQAIKSGDFQHLISDNGHAVTYIPYRGAEQLRLELLRYKSVINDLKTIMQGASGHRLMQVAEPARRCLNLIKELDEN